MCLLVAQLGSRSRGRDRSQPDLRHTGAGGSALGGAGLAHPGVPRSLAQPCPRRGKARAEQGCGPSVGRGSARSGNLPRGTGLRVCRRQCRGTSVVSAAGLPGAKESCPRPAPRRPGSRRRARGRAAAGREKPELHRPLRPFPSYPVSSRPRDAGAEGPRRISQPRERGPGGPHSLPAGRGDPRLASPGVPAWENHDLVAAAGVGPWATTGATCCVGCAWPGCGGWRGRRGRCQLRLYWGRILPGAWPQRGHMGLAVPIAAP